MSWIGELDPYVQSGLIGGVSTLVAGLVGAGSALLAGRVGQKRRERREDKALWSDRRHLAYAELLELADQISDTAREVELDSMHQAPPGNFIDTTEKLEVLHEKFESQVKRTRLMTGKKLRQQLRNARVELGTLVSQLNHHLLGIEGVTFDYLRELAEVTRTKLATAEVQMRAELGLPEDE